MILSAAIHPDFEKGGEHEVVMKIMEVKEQSLEGQELPPDATPLKTRVGDQNQFDQELPEYEKTLQQHMVHHLVSDHRLPALSEIDPKAIKDFNKVMPQLEDLIKNGKNLDAAILKGQYVRLAGKVISLEAMLNIYIHQIRNEFTVLENLLPQGYVYTINPPTIFIAQIGQANANILNRLQLLALKMHNESTPLNNLKIIGFGDYADKGIVDLYTAAFLIKRHF